MSGRPPPLRALGGFAIPLGKRAVRRAKGASFFAFPGISSEKVPAVDRPLKKEKNPPMDRKSRPLYTPPGPGILLGSE